MKIKKTAEPKVMRDVIHGYIHIEDQIIWDLINTREVQKLRRIRQLGGVYQVYHTAEHSRFSHSLGVYQICRRMADECEDIQKVLKPEDRIAFLCAGLLHDIGHGPYSHLFESISKINHEQMGCQIISDLESEVNQVLRQADEHLPLRIVRILSHQETELPLLSQMISSQLDADRMDYLLRDAYGTGTSYGHFDLERILRTLRVVNGTLCVKDSGVHAIEDYIMARYEMYWQVYLHPNAYGYELLIRRFFKRYEQIRQEYPIAELEKLYGGKLDAKTFFEMDDIWLSGVLMKAAENPDAILRDLSIRLRDRKLLIWQEVDSSSEMDNIQQQVQEAGFDPEIYTALQQYDQRDNLPYWESEHEGIYIMAQEKLVPLSQASVIAKALLTVMTPTTTKIYYPQLEK